MEVLRRSWLTTKISRLPRKIFNVSAAGRQLGYICTPNMGVNLSGEDDFGHPVPCTKTGLNKEIVCQMFSSE